MIGVLSALGRALAWRALLRVAAASMSLGLAVLGVPAASHAADRHAAMIVDVNTGKMLHEDAADQPRYPASLTKMMTLYLVFEALESGQLKPDQRLVMTQEGANVAPSKLNLDPGEDIAVMDGVKVLITKSANDIAVAFAQRLGGTEAEFARAMTEKARKLGMAHTIYFNASGLPDTRQLTTARDMLTLAMHLHDDFPRYFPLFATKVFAYNGASMRNHNTLLNTLPGTDGIKTGYTRLSGFNVVASVHRGSKHLIGVVFGGQSATTRNAEMAGLMSRAFLRASPDNLRAAILVARAKPVQQPAQAPPQVAEATLKIPALAQGLAPSLPEKVRPAVKLVALSPQVETSRPFAEPTRGVSAGAAKPIEIEAAPTAPAPPMVATTPAPVARPLYEVARVRHVMVAPHVKPAPPVAAVTAQAPLPPPVQLASLAPSPRPEPAPPAVLAPRPSASIAVRGPAMTPVQAAAPGVAPGLPPSTFQQQAARLAMAGSPVSAGMVQPPSYHLQGPSPVPFAQALAGTFALQVGAYATPGEAARALDHARQVAGPLLASATPVTQPVQKDARELFRARFAGFDANGAAQTCLELRRRGVDCFVMRAQ